MKTKTYKVYKFKELPKEAQAKALDNYRHYNVEDGWHTTWHDDEDMQYTEQLEERGYNDIELFYTGFSSQGDGASFTATVDIVKWLEYHSIAWQYPLAYSEAKAGNIDGAIKRYTHHYYHEYTMYPDIDYIDNGELTEDKLDELNRQIFDIEEHLTKEAREISRNYYASLEKAYEYLTSDEAVREVLELNDYDFTLDGKID